MLQLPPVGLYPVIGTLGVTLTVYVTQADSFYDPWILRPLDIETRGPF